jgi:8-amino-7-oxononanoate synthase
VFICGPVNQSNEELGWRLEALREQGLRRELRRVDSAQGPRIKIGGKTLLNFSSNDYLGLANHPTLKEAAIKAVEKFGAGAGASRLICGSLAPFHKLEEILAAFKGTEAALTFSSGYAAAIGTICALLGRDDTIIIDKLVHACIVDGARLCGAKLRVFDHNDLSDLEDILKWANKKKSQIANRKSQVLIVTESIFSMDGDAAPLREIVALKEKYDAWLMVDEAHATGLYGKNRRGLAEELGVSGQIEIQMGTLGKALGASGGYICGQRSLIDYLVNRARSFIFSTAPVPAAAAAATAGIQLVKSAAGKSLNEKLWARVAEFQSAICSPQSAISSAIIPLIIGDEARAVAAALKLRSQNIFIPAIRYATVARGAARLRVTLTAAHAAKDVAQLIRVLTDLKSEIQNLKSP